MVFTTQPDAKTTFSPPLRRWTVEEYHNMAKLGILHPEEKVELIAGQILQKMSPQGSPHAAAVTRSNRLLGQRLGEQGLVRIQLPIILNDFSEPEPDIAVVRTDPLDYDDHHPTVEDVLLIIEIADTTIRSDRTFKTNEYARSGITDYWVLDINQRQLHIYRNPSATGYQQEQVLGENATITPLQFPDCTIQVAELLRPQR